MIIATFVCGVMFSSCNSDKEELLNDNSVVIETARIKAISVENAKSEIATVRAIVTNWLCHETEECRIEFEVASSKFKNDGFELNFSKTVPDKYLSPIFVDEGFTVSDSQAKIGTISLYVFDSSENRIGNFEIMNGVSHWSVDYVYSDRSFTMKGKTAYGLEVDYSFNKGWNNIYYSYEGAHYYTTQKPVNVDFKCVFPIPERCGTKR